MNFGEVIRSLEAGHAVTRKEFGSKYIWMLPEEKLHFDDYDRNMPMGHIAYVNNGDILQHPTLCMKTENNELMVGWVPSVIDIFAKDWMLVF
jgi:hypothetical protein